MRSTVFEWGENSVIKVPLDDTPDAWTDFEFRYGQAVARSADVAVPRFRQVVEHGGRRCVVASRVWAPSMIEALIADPSRAVEFGELLADVQLGLFAVVPSLELPNQIDRLSCKVRMAGARHGIDYADVLEFLRASEPVSLVLCHGDLHPRNVLLAEDGPVLIDWFDTCRGRPVAEVARSLLLLEQFGSVDLTPELALIRPETFQSLAAAYLVAVQSALGFDDDELRRWSLVQRIARAAEGLDSDPLEGPEVRRSLLS